MTIERNPSAAIWGRFLRTIPRSSVLQTWGWGAFQARVGRPVARMFILDGGRPVAAAQVLHHRYPLGFHSLYLPHGPVIDQGALTSLALADSLADGLRALAQEAQAVFVRLEPPQAQPLVARLPLRPVAGLQPQTTHVLDVRQSEAELLAALHQKTRYNLRVAERSGVRVTQGGAELTETFLGLLRATEAREQVRFFTPQYFQALWSEPELAPHLTYFLAWVGPTPVAGSLIVRTHDTAVYLHGGSIREHREKMAPYVMHWTAIRVAKQQGLQWYDFRGVAPAAAPADHPWAGFSRFKRGFGGVDVTYPGAYDWVRRPFWYGLYRLAQRAR